MSFGELSNEQLVYILGLVDGVELHRIQRCSQLLYHLVKLNRHRLRKARSTKIRSLRIIYNNAARLQLDLGRVGAQVTLLLHDGPPKLIKYEYPSFDEGVSRCDYVRVPDERPIFITEQPVPIDITFTHGETHDAFLALIPLDELEPKCDSVMGSESCEHWPYMEADLDQKRVWMVNKATATDLDALIALIRFFNIHVHIEHCLIHLSNGVDLRAILPELKEVSSLSLESHGALTEEDLIEGLTMMKPECLHLYPMVLRLTEKFFTSPPIQALKSLRIEVPARLENVALGSGCTIFDAQLLRVPQAAIRRLVAEWRGGSRDIESFQLSTESGTTRFTTLLKYFVADASAKILTGRYDTGKRTVVERADGQRLEIDVKEGHQATHVIFRSGIVLRMAVSRVQPE